MAGFGPRRPHPPPSHPTVARISPMVPEVSLFMSNGLYRSMHEGQLTGPPQLATDGMMSNVQAPSNFGKEFRPVAHQHFATANISSETAMRPADPPSPQENLLLQGINKPTPDFSRIFDDNSNVSQDLVHTSAPSAVDTISFPDYVEPFSSHSTQRVSASPVETTDNVTALPFATNLSQPGEPPRATCGELAATATDSTIQPEILKVLTWQNEQLKLLQEQVKVLLDSSPHLKSSTWTNAGGHNLVETPTQCNREAEERGLQGPLSSPVLTSASTNTSLLWPEIQTGLRRLQNVAEENEVDVVNRRNDSCSLTLTEMRKSNIKVNTSDGDSVRSPQPTINIDLPDYPGSECSPDLRKQRDMVSWESPVLGESVTMYEEQQQYQEQRNMEDVYHDIISKVNKLLTEPLPPVTAPDSIGQSRHMEELDSRTQLQPETPGGSTLSRLRQLGVSFISPQDLDRQCLENSQPSGMVMPKSTDCSAMFLPKAACPSQSLWQRDSTDTSLEISSLALKYLDEAQLSRLADRHRGSAVDGLGTSPMLANDVNMSLATQQFLDRHGLGQTNRVQRQPLNNKQEHQEKNIVAGHQQVEPSSKVKKTAEVRTLLPPGNTSSQFYPRVRPFHLPQQTAAVAKAVDGEGIITTPTTSRMPRPFASANPRLIDGTAPWNVGECLSQSREPARLMNE